jgi:hypothetical protein
VGPSEAANLNLANVPLLSVGIHTLVLSVSDGQATTTSSMSLTVNNSPPAVACHGSGTYQFGIDTVQLTASVADFDGDMLSYSWDEDTNNFAHGVEPTTAGGAPSDLPSTNVATGAPPNGVLGLGSHVIQLAVNDNVNARVTCSVSAQVVDTQAPTLAPTSNVRILWPPNHQMVDIVIQANAHDSSGAPVTLSATVTSSEDPQKDGSGNTIPDFTTPVIDQSTGAVTLQLRAERSGNGPGRTYTITITATDLAGNMSTASLAIVAPHDQQKK